MEVCCQPEKVLRTPGYRERYEACTPDAEVVAALGRIAIPVTVLVVYGAWCRDSERIVPGLLRALSEAGNALVRLLTVHVAYSETDPSPFMAGPVPVERYPTVSLLKGSFDTLGTIEGGAELVRFVERPLSADLLVAAIEAANA